MSESSSEYYKKATESKKKEKYEEAVEFIRKGIEIDKKNNVAVLIATFLRIPMYYSYNNQIAEALSELEIIEKQCKLFCDLAQIYDTKRKIYQSVNNCELSIVNGIKSFLYEYCHYFSDFFTGLGQNEFFFKSGTIDRKTFEERKKKCRDLGQSCADEHITEENIMKSIKKIVKKSTINDEREKILKNYILEKVKFKDKIDFTLIENEVKDLLE